MITKHCQCGSTNIFKSRTRDHGYLCSSCWTKYKANNQVDKPDISNVSKNSSSSEKSIPELLELAQIVFNRWIRRRDSFDGMFNCISCDEWLSVSVMDAGHYFPTTYSALRFHEDNVHGECAVCNRMDDKHLVRYSVNLLNKIGPERFKWLEDHRHDEKKWDRDEFNEIIRKYK